MSPVEAGGVSPHLDRALLHVAHWGPGFARAADAYAGAFARPSILRRKLVLLAAILESRGETARLLDTAHPGSRLILIAELVARGGLVVLLVTLALLLLAPLRLWYRVAHAESL